MSKEELDNLKIYCRTLGHKLMFKYCRTTTDNELCKKIRDCWFDKINIDKYLNENYSEKELEVLNKASQPKMLSLFEIMKQAQERVKKENN